jgi:enediyne biosynthesis protein E7
MSSSQSAFRRPPGPATPVSLGVDPATLDILQSACSEFGNIVAFTKPNGRAAYFINDPAEIRRMLVRQHANYVKGPGFERVKMLLGNGLIVSDGDVWRRSRTMIQPAFSRANVHQLIMLMVQCCEKRHQRWTSAATAGEVLNITQETSDFALELILRSIFGADYDRFVLADGINPFAFLSDDSTRDLRVVLKVRELRRLVLGVIGERRRDTSARDYDFLAAYVNARDKSGKAFDDDELLDELMTLIIAGYETSAGTLNWAWFLLARYPHLHETLAGEARTHIPNAQAIDNESIGGMRYAQAFLEETLRLYPPVWIFSRRAIADDKLDAYDLPAGTDIYLSPYILHRSERFWPQPLTVDPERFETEPGSAKGELAYFPFSLGPRRCLGEYFSFLEMKIHLGLLAQKFTMHPVDDAEPLLDLGINLRSQSDIFLRPGLRIP